jgi:hypothetical protein
LLLTLENERGEESFVLLLLPKLRRRSGGDENSVVEEVNLLSMWVVLGVCNLSVPGLENEGEGESGSFEEDPSAKLEVRLLGSRDTEELSFFRAAGGGVGAALAAAPFASTCSFCLLAELGVGEGGTTTGLLLPSGLLAEAFAPNFPGVLMLLLLLLRLKKFAGVLGVKGVRGDPDPATDGMLLDGLPEAFNGILFSAASAAAHFLSSAAVMSTDLVRDEREDKETRLRRGLQSAEVGTEENEARRESAVGVEEGMESDGNAPDKLCLIRGVLGADSLFVVVVVVRVLVFTGGGSMDMIGAPSLRLPEEFPFRPFSESLDIWTPTSLPPSLLLLLQIASSSRRTATFPPEYDDLGAARGVVDPEVLLLLLLPAVLFFNSDEEVVGSSSLSSFLTAEETSLDSLPTAAAVDSLLSLPTLPLGIIITPALSSGRDGASC